MKLLILNNMAAGFGSGPVYDFARIFSEAGDEVTIRSVDPSVDFTQALADVSRFDAVVPAGGDGTHSSVCYLLRYSGIPILPFPSGTANLMAQNLILPEDPAALAALVRNPQTLEFDMGEIHVGDERFGFTMMAGCGYDAIIMDDAKKTKDALGPVSYFKAAFDNPNPPVADITLDLDGTIVETEGVGVMIINFSKIQFDISLGPSNRPRDGMFDVVVMHTKNAWELLPSFIGAAMDRPDVVFGPDRSLRHYRAKQVRVLSDPVLPMQFDGETGRFRTPFTARLLPRAIKVILGNEAIEEFATE